MKLYQMTFHISGNKLNAILDKKTADGVMTQWLDGSSVRHVFGANSIQGFDVGVDLKNVDAITMGPLSLLDADTENNH